MFLIFIFIIIFGSKSEQTKIISQNEQPIIKLKEEDYEKQKKEVQVNREIWELLEEAERNEKAERIFQQDQQGRDKSVSAQQEGVFHFKVQHLFKDHKTESPLQMKPVILNQHACYFLETDKTYRSIIGGFDLYKVFAKGIDQVSRGQCCHNVGQVHLVQLLHDDYTGYCFTVTLLYEQWTLCHQSQQVLAHFQLHLRVQVLAAVIRKYNLDIHGNKC